MTAVKQTYWWHSAGIEAAVHDIKEAKQNPSRESPKCASNVYTLAPGSLPAHVIVREFSSPSVVFA